MEIVLLCLFASWALMRYGVTDAIAAAKGTESPRVGERRQRAAHAHERAMARTGPTVGEAIAGRIAHRIANSKQKDGTPRERGPARQFAAELWGDSWAWAAEKRRTQQERGGTRRQPQADSTGTNPSTDRPAPGSEATGPDGGDTNSWGWTYDPRRDGWPTGRHARGTATTEPEVLDGEVVDTDRDGETDPDGVIDAEEVDQPTPEPGAATSPTGQDDTTDEAADGGQDDTDHDPTDNPTDDPTQDTTTTTGTPLASVHPIREDITMSAPTAEHSVGSGETLDPGSAKRFSEDIKGLGEQINQSLETSISNLEERGVSGEPVDLFRQMQEAAQTLIGHSETARSHFERHEGTQDQVLSDDTLAGTVADGYLGARS